MKSSLILSLSAIAAANSFPASQYAADSDEYFHGQSPPVYPSPSTNGKLPEWVEAKAKAVALVSQMTIDEKANITVGAERTTRCSGQTGSVPRLGFPGLCTTGAGNGIRQAEFVNGWPAGVHIGATFNKNLTYRRGRFMGEETLKKGSNALGGPVMGPLGRIAMHGRNWEGFSNDPYLAGALSALTVKGIQEEGVMSMSKHFIGYEQQTGRLALRENSTLVHDTYSSNMNDRTMHELYLWPFADSVREGTACIMCSYNRLNNSRACQNSKALNGLLKTELGFPGWVVSDWYAQDSGVASAMAGLDMAMPSSDKFWGKSGSLLAEAVRNGSLPEERLDDMVVRLVTPWYLLGQDEGYLPPGAGLPLDYTAPHTPLYAKNSDARLNLLQGAIEGQVLVKNVQGALPLNKPRMLSIFGYDAPAPRAMNIAPAAQGNLFSNAWSSGYLSVNLTGPYNDIINGIGSIPSIGILGTLITGGGSGGTSPSYISSPFDAITQQAIEDNTAIFYDFEDTDPPIAYASSACLVFINAWAAEGIDRPELYDSYSDNLVLNVASKCNNTIVTIHNAGIRLVDQWADHPNVTAIIFAHLPGQDSGRAIKAILYDDVSPSGRLPYTVAKNESDYGPMQSPDRSEDFEKFPQSNYTEGLYIDYRWFDKQDIAPRYEFGFGLSYTTFEYADLTMYFADGTPSALPVQQEILPGGNPDLYSIILRVSAKVRNTGTMEAAEVAQLYIGLPGQDTPVRQLRGFAKKVIGVGREEKFEFEVRRKDLSVWDVGLQEWVIRRGEYKIFVGKSSRDLPLEDTLMI